MHTPRSCVPGCALVGVSLCCNGVGAAGRTSAAVVAWYEGWEGMTALHYMDV
jgi:hypothetical protein